MSRRDLLVGALGFGVGGVLATATGLGYYFHRRAARSNAQRPTVPVSTGIDDWVLTEADRREAANRDDMPDNAVLDLLDNVDISGGGDIRDLRVNEVGECISACENDKQCNAFTFARLSHPITEKRHMCWIKSDRDPPTRILDVHYISGLRK